MDIKATLHRLIKSNPWGGGSASLPYVWDTLRSRLPFDSYTDFASYLLHTDAGLVVFQVNKRNIMHHNDYDMRVRLANDIRWQEIDLAKCRIEDYYQAVVILVVVQLVAATAHGSLRVDEIISQWDHCYGQYIARSPACSNLMYLAKIIRATNCMPPHLGDLVRLIRRKSRMGYIGIKNMENGNYRVFIMC